MIRYWRFVPREGVPYESRVTYRCDMSTKCLTCSAVQNFGVPISDELYAGHRGHQRKMIWWKERQ